MNEKYPELRFSRRYHGYDVELVGAGIRGVIIKPGCNWIFQPKDGSVYMYESELLQLANKLKELNAQ